MTDAPLSLIAADGRAVALPLAPETLVRRLRASRERLEFTVHLDDRLEEGRGTTADALATLAEIGGEVSELRWGRRRFRVRLAELTVTETAFGPDLEPVAAALELAVEVVPSADRAVSVTVAGERWRRVPDLRRAGPSDPVYEVAVADDGSMHIRFGDGKRGARPPAGEVVVHARYRVGAGPRGRPPERRR